MSSVGCEFVAESILVLEMGTRHISSWIPPEMRWLSRQVWPFLPWHVASFFCISLGTLLVMLSPLVLKWLIDEILPDRRMGLLLGAVALIFLFHQGRVALTSISGYVTMIAAQRLALSLRLRLLRHLDTLSPEYHEGTHVGATMYPLKEPIDEISFLGSDLLPAIVRTVAASVLTLGMMLLLNPKMTLAIVPFIPVFLITRRHFRTSIESASESVQHNQLAWGSFLQEHFCSITAIQLLRQERRQQRTGLRLLYTSARSLVRLFHAGVWFTFYTSLSVALAMSAVVGYGGWNVSTGTLTVGGLAAFYTYLTQLFEGLSGGAELYLQAQKTFASIRQVKAALAKKPAITDVPSATNFPHSHSWTIELADVRFEYPNNRGAISIQHLEIRAGECVAIVGENGAGKSTLAKLLARSYDANSGSILIAGEDVRKIKLDSLREHVCYSPPQPILFDATLACNLRLGKPTASDAELDEVIGHVGLATWVSSLPTGLKHRIGPGGSGLSGGQRQRIALARAILQRPRIMLLDEATSSVDATSEQILLTNLRGVLPGATIIVISHRRSALFCVERVVVLHAGHIIEDHTPATVLKHDAKSSRLFDASLSTPGSYDTSIDV